MYFFPKGKGKQKRLPCTEVCFVIEILLKLKFCNNILTDYSVIVDLLRVLKFYDDPQVRTCLAQGIFCVPHRI